MLLLFSSKEAFSCVEYYKQHENKVIINQKLLKSNKPNNGFYVNVDFCFK